MKENDSIIAQIDGVLNSFQKQPIALKKVIS